jgi:hypothetical protein
LKLQPATKMVKLSGGAGWRVLEATMGPDTRQTPRSPAKRSTPHLCSHRMHSLRSFSMLKPFRSFLVPSNPDGGFSVPRWCFALGGISASLQQVAATMFFFLTPETSTLPPDTYNPEIWCLELGILQVRLTPPLAPGFFTYYSQSKFRVRNQPSI